LTIPATITEAVSRWENAAAKTPSAQTELTILALIFLSNVVSCSYYLPGEALNESVPVLLNTSITAKGDSNLDAANVINVLS